MMTTSNLFQEPSTHYRDYHGYGIIVWQNKTAENIKCRVGHQKWVDRRWATRDIVKVSYQ